MPLTLPNTSPPHVCVVPCSIYLTYCFGSGGRHGGSRAGGGWQLAFAFRVSRSGVRVAAGRVGPRFGSGARAVVRLSFVRVVRCVGWLLCGCCVLASFSGFWLSVRCFWLGCSAGPVVGSGSLRAFQRHTQFESNAKVPIKPELLCCGHKYPLRIRDQTRH